MLPVCSAAHSTSSPSQLFPLHDGLCPFSSSRRHHHHHHHHHHPRIVDSTSVSAFSSDSPSTLSPARFSLKTHASSNPFCSHFPQSPLQPPFLQDSPAEPIDILHPHLSSSPQVAPVNLTNASTLVGRIETETLPVLRSAPDNLNLEPNAVAATDSDATSSVSVPSSFDDLVSGANDSFNTSMSKAESFFNSITKSASQALDNASSKVFSSVDRAGEAAADSVTNVSTDLRAAANKAADISIDALRGAVVAAENSIAKGASFVVYSYGSAKEFLPPQIRETLNLSEEKAVQLLRPVGSAFQQVYVGIEGLEKSLGFDPNDPVVSFVLFLGTSATLWVVYWVWAYGGYSGDLSPDSTLELLAGEDKAVLIDVRPEVLREREGIPDLRRAARFRYASVTLPEVDRSTRKLLKGGREVDDTLIAAVIKNLKGVQDRSKVIVMDSDGSRSKGIARSLRKLGVRRPYLVKGGFQSWTKLGLRVKELKPETTLTVLNEEAEAILEEMNPSPVQALGYGVGFVAALYALLEWEKTLQLIAIIGLGQTIYRRVASYEKPDDIKQDVRLLLTPIKLGADAFSWAAGKLETNGIGIGLPLSPSSSDVQSRVLQAAAKHESQPSSDGDGMKSITSESVASVNENVDLSEA